MFSASLPSVVYCGEIYPQHITSAPLMLVFLSCLNTRIFAICYPSPLPRVLSFCTLQSFVLLTYFIVLQEQRVLLTGTPLQNNVEELYSLLSFLEPKQFASSEAFMADFGKLESETQVDKLKAVSGTLLVTT